MAYTAITTSDLLKQYFEPGMKEQVFNKKILLSKLKKNRSDIYGGSAKVALHTGRNAQVGSRGNAAALMSAGQQSTAQAEIPLRYHYGKTYVSGPDVVNSKSDKGAFARVLTYNMNGLLDDMQADINRQLFSDGSGMLAIASSTSSTTSLPILPYIWDVNAARYFPIGTAVQTYDVTDWATSNLTTNTQAGADAAQVASSTNTTIVTATDNFATNGAGDPVGKYGSLQVFSSNTAVQYEMMGLWGICHDGNLIFDANYAFDTTNSVTNFVGPEGQNYDYTVASQVNRLQGIDASAAAGAYWKGVSKANGGVTRAISFQLLDQLFGELSVTNGASTDLIVSTYQVRDKYVDLMRQDRRFVDTKTLDGGFDAVMYRNVPWTVDKDAPRGAAFFLDTSMLSLYVGEDFGFVKDGSGNVQFQSTDYDYQTIIGRCMMNLGVHCRNRQGVLRDINEA